jgi:peptide/nickel transport system substrate-binding protein
VIFVANYDNSDEPKSKTLVWNTAWQDETLNGKVDGLLLEADPAKRAAGYQALIKEWQPKSPWALLFQQILVAAYTPNVENFLLGPSPETTLYINVSKK